LAIMDETLVYVGTYTFEGGEGIYIYHMDPDSGRLKNVGKVKNLVNPSFLKVNAEKRSLYAVNEFSSFDRDGSGAVSAFLIEEDGTLTFLNSRSSGGAGPCYVSIDRLGRYVFVANYVGGSISVLPISGDGSLEKATEVIRHKGSSINLMRQEAPHPHSIIIDPPNKHVYVPDLGLDKIMIYRFDSSSGRLEPSDQPWVATKPGSGPRHITFHPGGKFVYVINELDSTIVAYKYDGGRLEALQTISALPSDFRGENYSADIHVHPSGKFLYGSNRGHDSIVVYRVDEESGTLKWIGHEYTRGRTPRNFAIDPSGRFLLVANQRSNKIVSFLVDQETGALKPLGHEVHVPSPACVEISPL